ncbi:MAG: hypothetical protein LUQ40_01710 [Methanomicrobiales archaeon]|nr:hypothetical protein [Methanomicrobiales archaeon]
MDFDRTSFSVIAIGLAIILGGIVIGALILQMTVPYAPVILVGVVLVIVSGAAVIILKSIEMTGRA